MPCPSRRATRLNDSLACEASDRVRLELIGVRKDLSEFWVGDLLPIAGVSGS